MPATGGASFTTAHRVVNRVHNNTTHRRAYAAPAPPAGFAVTNVTMIKIANLADCRTAVHIDLPDLT